MNLPIGKLFYFVPKIQGYSGGTTYDNVNVTSGDHYAPVGSPGNYPGDPNGGYGTSTGAYQKNLYDLFYEGTEPGLDPAGLFDYSKGRFVTVTGSTPTVAWSNGALVYSAYTVGGVNLEFRKIIVALSGFSSAGVGKLIGPDGQEIDTESFLSNLVLYTDNSTVASNLGTSTFTPLLFRVVTQKYGGGIVNPTYTQSQATFGNAFASSTQGNGGLYDNACSPTGFIYLEIDAQVPVCVACGQSTPDGYSGATLTASQWSGASSATNIKAAWRRYEELEFEDKIGEVSFDLESVTVSVTERKLRAQWSPELAQDVAAFHNIDAEAELTALLSEQVAAEIDREILRDLRKGAAWNLRWDYNGWRRLSATTSYTQKDWNQTLITAINQLSAQIHKSTLRGGANWIVVSSEISAIFDDLEYFHVSNASPEQDQYNMGIERVGTLAGRYQVYRDPYFPANTVLVGHKGTSLLDTGYIYAPYVPLQLTPTMYNPFNFTPIKGIMTRYAKKMVNNRFYGRITVDGVRTFDLRELR
jgi:hypothetical protein